MPKTSRDRIGPAIIAIRIGQMIGQRRPGLQVNVEGPQISVTQPVDLEGRPTNLHLDINLATRRTQFRLASSTTAGEIAYRVDVTPGVAPRYLRDSPVHQTFQAGGHYFHADSGWEENRGKNPQDIIAILNLVRH